MKDVELWSRLQAFSFPLTSNLGSLQAHLANRTTLGPEKAARAINEYRRFLYLAATSGEVVAPSPLIDRVWHTHIEDTRAYLGEFSSVVMGRVIHHAPGRKSAAKDPAYRRTMALYREEFGEAPFDKVWPRPEQLQFAWVWTILLAAGTFGIFFLPNQTLAPFQKFLATVAYFWVFGIVYARWTYWSVRSAKDGSGCSSCGGGDGGCGGD